MFLKEKRKETAVSESQAVTYLGEVTKKLKKTTSTQRKIFFHFTYFQFLPFPKKRKS